MTDAIRRGESARALLDNALLREALKGLEAHYMAAWRLGRSVEAREDCHRYVVLVEKLGADLTSIATTGALERQRLAELEGGRKFSLAWPKI